MTFFNMPYLNSTLKKGVFYIFRGALKRQGNRLMMEQPAIYKPEVYEEMAGRLLPEYILTKGLSNQMVTKSVKQAFEVCAPQEEFLPEDVAARYRFLPHFVAMHEMHFPTDKETLFRARNRLVFEEFFLFILMLRRMKADNHELPNSFKMMETADTVRLLQSLPYRLTGAQCRVWEEIKNDLCGDTVMSRLIQGDVGSGKTILAFLALIMCAANGYQGAMMAPTEVLARQHYETFTGMCIAYSLERKVILLTGSLTAR